MQAAPSNRPILRLSLAAAVAVLMGAPLVACNQDKTADTAGTAAGEQDRGERAGEVQPTDQQATGQQMGQQQQEMGTAQPGTRQQGMQAQQDQQNQPGQPGMDSGAQDVMAARANCPMMVEGASVDVENTEDGVALRFTSTNAGQVEELRNRVESMARMYERKGEQAGSMMWHPMGHRRADQDQKQAKGPTGAIPAATTRVEEIENGARLVLTPKDRGDLDQLREHVRDHERRMEAGECWMAQGQAGAQGQTGAQGRTDAGAVDDSQPGHRQGESAPGDGRPKT